MNETPPPPPPPPPFTPPPTGPTSRAKKSVLPWVLGGCGCLTLIAVIVALVYAVVSRQMNSPTEVAKRVHVRADIQSIATQLKLYESMNDFLPTTDQGLQALVTQPSTEPKPTRWYQLFKEIPKDPWGSNYIYLCPGRKNPTGFDLYSAGPDRKADTSDDDWGQ